MAEIKCWLIHFDGRLWTDPDSAPPREVEMAEIKCWLIHFDGRLWTDPDGAPRCFASEAAAESEAQACAEYAAFMLGRDNVASWSVREFRLVPALAREVQRLTAERDDAREMTHAALDDIGAPGDRSVPPWERIGRIAPLGQEPTT